MYNSNKYALNNEIAKHIRAVESSLIESQQIDLTNSFHYTRMVDRDACMAALSDCVLPSYVQRLYRTWVRPIYFYIEYINNYISIEKMAADYNLTTSMCRDDIDLGRALHQRLTTFESNK